MGGGGTVKTNHAQITGFVKPQVNKSRTDPAENNSRTNHANHVCGKTAGQQITHVITAVTRQQITFCTVPLGTGANVSEIACADAAALR